MPKKTTTKQKGKDICKTKKGKTASNKKKTTKKKQTNMERMLEQIGIAKCPNLELIRKSIGKRMFVSNRESGDEKIQINLDTQKMSEHGAGIENNIKKDDQSKSKNQIEH